MNFIHLIDYDGQKIVINPAMITSIRPIPNGGCYINFGSWREPVRESINEVLAQILLPA